MNPVTFKWNDTAKDLNKYKDTERVNYGLIAQELKEIAPELVHTIYGDQYYSIDYEKIIPILIQGWKEQQKEIQKLKKQK